MSNSEFSDMGPLKIRAYKVAWSNRVELLGAIESSDSLRVAQNLTFGHQQNSHLEIDPFASLRLHEAQVLMDSLWECGLRPSEGTGSAGAMKATERHLNDMRKIAGAKLNVSL